MVLKVCRLVLLAVACAASSLPAHAEDAKYHRPQTEAERVLDKVFTLENDSNDLFDFILSSTKDDPAKYPGYSQLFTKALLKTWRTRKKEWLLCNDTPTGEACGLDYSPITCGQDRPDGFLFHTIKSDTGTAIIAVSREGLKVDVRYVRYYRLLKHKDRWALDGVHCGELKKFNMSTVP
jgi:hypothetical protein